MISSFGLGLMVFILHHFLLKINFQTLLGLNGHKLNWFIILISGMRTLIIASLLFLLIVKLKQNIFGIIISLVFYQLILMFGTLYKSPRK